MKYPYHVGTGVPDGLHVDGAGSVVDRLLERSGIVAVDKFHCDTQTRQGNLVDESALCVSDCQIRSQFS